MAEGSAVLARRERVRRQPGSRVMNGCQVAGIGMKRACNAVDGADYRVKWVANGCLGTVGFECGVPVTAIYARIYDFLPAWG